jgi:hypothetical protein
MWMIERRLGAFFRVFRSSLNKRPAIRDRPLQKS